MDEGQLRIADPHHVARLERVIGVDPHAVDHRAIATVQIAERPLALRLKHLGVIAAAAFVLDDDGIGRRPAHRDRFAVHQTEHVRPLGAFANYEVCRHCTRRKNIRKGARETAGRQRSPFRWTQSIDHGESPTSANSTRQNSSKPAEPRRPNLPWVRARSSCQHRRASLLICTPYLPTRAVIKSDQAEPTRQPRVAPIRRSPVPVETKEAGRLGFAPPFEVIPSESWRRKSLPGHDCRPRYTTPQKP